MYGKSERGCWLVGFRGVVLGWEGWFEMRDPDGRKSIWEGKALELTRLWDRKDLVQARLGTLSMERRQRSTKMEREWIDPSGIPQP